MVFKTAGTLWKKNTKTKLWWGKLAIALVLSNVFFFYLFSGSDEEAVAQELPGWVEVSLPARLLTPFSPGKKILLLNRAQRLKLAGTLKATEGDFVVVDVPEDVAQVLFKHEGWEILPYLKEFAFRTVSRGETHEIRY